MGKSSRRQRARVATRDQLDALTTDLAELTGPDHASSGDARKDKEVKEAKEVKEVKEAKDVDSINRVLRQILGDPAADAATVTLDRLPRYLRAPFVAEIADISRFMFRCLDSGQHQRITEKYPLITAPRAELDTYKQRILSALADVGAQDITQTIDRATFRSYLRIETCRAAGRTMLIFNCDLPPQHREWMLHEYIANHNRARHAMVTLDAWTFIACTWVISPTRGVIHIYPEEYSVAELRRMAASTQCDICLLSTEEKLAETREARKMGTWDRRNPVSSAGCESGDCHLCMSCFARITHCPVCSKPAASFLVADSEEFPGEVPSKNELAVRERRAQRNRDDMRKVV